MANSGYQDTAYILDLLTAFAPRSILDLGAGFGRWGFLCRCHLGTGESLSTGRPQALTIDAVEGFEANINPVYEAVYDRVILGDVRHELPKLGEYDVVICSHMLEHLDREQAKQLLLDMRRHARRAVIVALPFHAPLRGPLDGNVFEAHRSVWRAYDFRQEPAFVRTFPFLKGIPTAVVVYPCDSHALWVAKTFASPWRRFAAQHLTILLRFVTAWKRKESSSAGKDI